MPLKEDIEYEPVLVCGPPKLVSNAIHARTHLVEMPPGAPSGLPVAQVFREEGSEFYAPLAQGFVTDHDAALVQQFLHIPVAQREAVVQPDGVLDDGQRESVSVGLEVGHGRSAYPDPVKATQSRAKMTNTLGTAPPISFWPWSHSRESAAYASRIVGRTSTLLRNSGGWSR